MHDSIVAVITIDLVMMLMLDADGDCDDNGEKMLLIMAGMMTMLLMMMIMMMTTTMMMVCQGYGFRAEDLQGQGLFDALLSQKACCCGSWFKR